MPNYDRDPKYLLPYLRANLKGILNDIIAKLPAGFGAKLVSGHRTPADQFEIYKKGRTFRNGVWVKTGTTYTNIDGFTRLSMHNYLPALAFDVGLFDAGGTYLGDSPHYRKIGPVAKAYGLDWGGDWTTFVDQPHVEIPKSMAFKGSFVKEAALQWQLYLTKDGTYTGVLDGIFGNQSQSALEASTGSRLQSLDTWKQLYDRLGPLSP